MNSILITGGAGYAGTTITEELAKKYPSSKIIVVDRNKRGCTEILPVLKEKYPNVDFVLPEKADIRDMKSMREVFRQYSPEIVVHLAAKVTDFAQNRPGKDEECISTNYEGTAQLAKLAKENNAKIFIHQSTPVIYELGGELSESSPKNPSTVYAKSKLMGEEAVLLLHDENFKVVVLRTATLVGYNLNFKYENMANIMCVRSVFKVPFSLFESALENEKSYLSVWDNAGAIIYAIENISKMAGESFNVISFNANLNKIVQLIKDELKEDFPYSIIPERTKNKQVYTLNDKKIRDAGFKPEDSPNVITSAVRKLKKQREFYRSVQNG